MTEFALIFPIVLLLIVGISDLGRVFAAGVVLETAARDAAEAGAQAYVANPPGPLDAAAPTGNAAYYAALDQSIGRAACSEAAELPGVDLDVATQRCASWPIVRACIHDDVDPLCGQAITGFNADVPAGCANLNSAWSNSRNGSTERWVEVRICYRFTSIVNGAVANIGEIFLERNRQFVIPCYFQLGANPCG
jgi:hypothetical protein